MNKRITGLAAAVCLLLTACTDISQRTLPTERETELIIPAESSSEATSAPADAETEASDTAEAADEAADEAASEVGSSVSIEEQYSSYTFSEEDEAYLDTCLFVGDSICGGLSHYGILPADHVISKGSVAARNIFDFKFGIGDSETDVLTAILNQKQDHIIFSMGMNDVNMTDTETYVANYFNLLTMVAAYCPDSELIVLSITPILTDSDFSANEKIDSYNAAIKDAIEKDGKPNWKYIDISPELKNSAGGLKSSYESGDGIHLAQAAYYAYLWQIVQERKTEAVLE